MSVGRRARQLGLAAAAVLVATAVAIAWPGVDDGGEEATAPVTTVAVSDGTGASTTATTTAPSDPRDECIAAWDLRRQVGQLVAIAVDGGALGTEAQRVADLGLGGVLLQRPAAAGLADGIAALKSASVIPPLVMADEEGGEVQTLSEVLGPLPSPARMADAYDPASARELVARHAESVAALGVDMVLGPVVDVATPGGGGPLGARVFGAEPATVTEYARAYVEAYEAAGVTTVLKHFPGHGAASGDSHEGPVSVPPTDELRARDLVPYEALLPEVDAVMVGHLVVPDLTGLASTSQSPEAIDGLLRDEYGFDRLVVTDSLSMGAIAFRTPPTEAAVQAVYAGADMALFVTIEDPAAVLDALVAATEGGRIDEAQVVTAVRRVLDQKGLDPCAVPA
jgi:beta-N-acetylhexosaminidase